MAICAAKGIPSSSMRLILSSSFCSLKCLGFKYRPVSLLYSVKAQHYLSKNRSILTLARTTFSPTQCLPVRAFMSTAISAESSHAPTASKSYDATQIQVLEGLDPVRKRPGMYIGSTGPRGLHHLVFEVLDNAVDEAQAGFATDINIVLHSDGSVSITDNGRGIPTDMHPATKKSSLETVLTVLHAGGKFGGEQSGYSVSGGLHGVGISVVNALSKRLEVTVWRNDKEWKQIFERGVPVTELTSEFIKEDSELNQGTRVKFLPDDEVFITTTTFDYNTIAERAREVAFLNPKVKITLKQEMEEGKVTSNEYYFAGGLSEYVQFLNQNKNQLHQPFSVNKEKDGVAVNVALQWCSDSYAEKLLGYANSIRTIDGGSHMDGLKSAITRAMNNVGRQLNIMKDKDENLSGEHVREGLTGIVSVKISKPEFEGQTKTRLGNPEVRKIVDQAVYDYFMDYLQCNPTICESILSKALNAYKAAMAAKRARELERKKSSLRSSAIPGKLANCSETDASKREIFIVEGESAGGSAKQGRDRRFQAILPLRGKILNVERKDEEAMYKNKEIHDLICALGIGEEGEDFRKNLNYHKIIILTDADVDGAHIRTLLLTFFFRYQKALFEEGVVYVGVPPLYKVERGKKATYCFDDNALKTLLKDYPENSSYNVQRFKGLGEMMPLQLWETTMNPATRKLKQLTIDDAEEADSVFTLLMGSNVEPRKKLIESSASKYMLENLDI